MRRLFDIDSRYSAAVQKLACLCVWNILLVLALLLVLPGGAALTALWYCLRKLRREGEAFPLRDFVRAFAENFVRATRRWLLFLGLALLLSADFLIVSSRDFPFKLEAYFVLGFLALLLGLVFLSFFYLLSKYRLENGRLFKLACLVCLQRLPYSLCLMLGLALLPLLSGLAPRLLPFWLSLGYALGLYAMLPLLERMFSRAEGAAGGDEAEEGGGEYAAQE